MIGLDDIKQLVQVQGEQVLSVYVYVDPAARGNQLLVPAWRQWLDEAMPRLDETIAPGQREVYASQRRRLNEFLESYRPKSKGLAMYFAPGFERVIELPIPVDENTASYGPLDFLPLLWLLDEYERYLVVLVTPDEAHFLTTYLGSIGREEAMASDRFTFDTRQTTLAPRAGETGSGQAAFVQDVARRAAAMMREIDAERIVIGGDAAALELRDSLDDSIRRSLVGVLPIPLDYTDAQVMERVLPAALEYERRQEMTLVEDIIAVAAAGGSSVLGHQAVAAAVESGIVETLICPWPLDTAGPVRALASAALLAGGRVELVDGDAAARLNAAGGLAARLR